MMDLAGKLGVTSVVVTHEMDSAFRIADRMAMLDRGRVLKVGTRQEFIECATTGTERTRPTNSSASSCEATPKAPSPAAGSGADMRKIS